MKRNSVYIHPDGEHEILEWDERYDVRQEMRAFDALPPKTRRAFANSNFSASAQVKNALKD